MTAFTPELLAHTREVLTTEVREALNREEGVVLAGYPEFDPPSGDDYRNLRNAVGKLVAIKFIRPFDTVPRPSVPQVRAIKCVVAAWLVIDPATGEVIDTAVPQVVHTPSVGTVGRSYVGLGVLPAYVAEDRSKITLTVVTDPALKAACRGLAATYGIV